MSIKHTIILILVIVISLSSAILFWVEQIAILPSFVSLQHAEATEDMNRCLNALKNEVAHLSTMAKDWSAWDDTYAFVNDRNSAYLESTLPSGSFVSGNFNLLYLYHKDGQLVWGESRDCRSAELIDIPEFGQSTFIEKYGLLEHGSTESSIDGIILTEKGPLLTSSKPIITSEDTGPIRGTLIMGRLLDRTMVMHLSQDLSVPFTVEILGTDPVSRQHERVLQQLTQTGSCVIEEGDQDHLNVYGMVRDIKGKPALLVEALVPTSIIARGKAAMLFTSCTILVIGVVTLVVTYCALDKTVICRLLRVCRRMEDIARSEDLSIRVDVSNSDELGRMEAHLNKMLEYLESTRQKIECAKQEWEGTFDAVPDLIAILDKHHRIVRVNRPMAERMGISPPEAVGRPCYECVHGTNAPPDACPHATFLTEGREQCAEIYEARLGGHFCVSVSPLLDSTGALLNTVHVARDINDRKQAEDMLRESTQRLALHVEQTPLAVVEWDLDFRVIEWNQGAENTFGYSRDQAMGRHGSFILPDKVKSHCSETWRALLEEREGYRSCNENISCEGRIIQCEWYNTPLIGPDGNVISVTSLALDITKRKQAEADILAAKERAQFLAQEAQAAVRAKSQFLANMSHEIRTPMNGIVGFSDLLAEEDLTKEQQEDVNIIRESAKHLLNLIDDILDFSKIEAGELTIEMMDCSLGQLLSLLESTMKPQAMAKSLDFRIVIDPDVPLQIKSDPHRLQQCLINLVNNAIKFTDKGHVNVQVSVHEDEGEQLIRFEVEDTGIGIPKHRQAAIFESFTQADGSTTRKYGGTGLGLTVTKELVELMGGKFTLTSEPGKGSVFSIMIPAGMDITGQAPLDQHNVTSQSQEESGNTGPTMFSGRILVAEDIKTNQMLMKSMLTKMGLEVAIAKDGNQALQEALSQSFDLIFMDMQMPNMNGYEATRQIRKVESADFGLTEEEPEIKNQKPKLSHVPIVALTADAMKGDDQKCTAAGCDDYLPKPVDCRELTRIIAKYLLPKQDVSSQNDWTEKAK